MFFKQLVRCPYLLASEEFSIFIRPASRDLERTLTYMPKLSAKKLLDKISPCYSINGAVDAKNLQNQQINLFMIQCKQNKSLLEQFKEEVHQME
jgi:hypothetical protein